MAGNPLIAQGTLNRLRGAITVASSPELNVTASFLGKEGISLAFSGRASTQIPTLTGAVQSPEPYMAATVTIELLKTQSIAALYKSRMEANCVIGDINIISDASTLPAYPLVNCSIQDVQPLKMNGEVVGFTVEISGFYIVNNDLWNI